MERDMRNQRSFASFASVQSDPASFRGRASVYAPRQSAPPGYDTKTDPYRRAAADTSRSSSSRARGSGARSTNGPAVRRVTAAQRRRQRRNRALLGVFLVLVVLLLGVLLSVSLLFKVTDYRITDMDGNTPADPGIYTEQQILDLLQVAPGDNLFGFSTAQESEQLAAQLPYLDEVKVRISLPGTVVVRVRPAKETFAVPLTDSWLILSDQLKVLRTGDTFPEGLIALDAKLPAIMPSVPGQYLKLETYNALTQVGNNDATQGDRALPTPVPLAGTDTEDANEILLTLVGALDTYGLLDGTTGISVADISELSFRYENRLQVVLGTMHNLEDKLKLASTTILDVQGQGLGATDHGVLDVSYQRSDGEIWAYLRPEDSSDTDPTAQPPAEEPPGENAVD